MRFLRVRLGLPGEIRFPSVLLQPLGDRPAREERGGSRDQGTTPDANVGFKLRLSPGLPASVCFGCSPICVRRSEVIRGRLRGPQTGWAACSAA
jgi:hypothetical protein